MTVSKPSVSPFYLIVRWIARISSIPIILIFILMFVGEGFDPAKVRPAEWVMLLFGPFGLILGMVIGWWKDGLGGAIALISYVGALIVGDYNSTGAGSLTVCAAPGFLFLLSWILFRLTGESKYKTVEENLPQPPATSEEQEEGVHP